MRVAVLGAGSWGTTLASVLAERQDTTVWAREPEVADAIEHSHQNPVFLPGFDLSPSLHAANDFEHALDDRQLVVVAVPAQFARRVLEQASQHIPREATIVSVSKGIEADTLERMTQVIEDVVPYRIRERLAVLAGPNFAREVLAGQPSATVIASYDEHVGTMLQRLFMTDSLRVYTNRDVVGCEIGGAIKNVLAIAAGIADGLGYGWNTKAALITRGLAELTRLGVSLGGKPLTFLGLAGNGDLVATCSSPESRNRAVGEQLGRGCSLESILGDMRMVAEGVRTAPAVLSLARRAGVEMPIAETVGAVLDGRLAPAEVVWPLMHREAKSELHHLED
jgi:glycerol-3-phosphate dehydrogenase (NAD(P)+)